MCVRARFCVYRSVATIQIWRSPRNVAHSTGIPDIKVLHKFAWRSQGRKKTKGRNKRQTYSPVLSVYLLAGPYWNSFPLSKLLPRGIWMKSVPHCTFSRRAGEEKAPIWAFTWCVSNNLQPFPVRFLPLFRKQQKHHHLEHRTQFTVVCQASVRCSTFISLFKVNNFFYFSVHVLQSLQDSCWTVVTHSCFGDRLHKCRRLLPPPRNICCLHCREDISRGKSDCGLTPPCPLGPALCQV